MDPTEYAFVKADGTVCYEFVVQYGDVHAFMKMHDAIRALPARDYKPPVPTYKTLELIMFHGRTSPQQEMDDWGFSGPTIKGIVWHHTTYNTHQRVGFADPILARQAQELTDWDWADELVLRIPIVEDLMVAKGRYYGDWELSPS